MYNKIYFLLILLTFSGCRNIEKVFESESPHDKYRQMLIETGASATSMGKSWIEKSENSLNDSLFITLPYFEEGYFFPEEVSAVSYRFNASRGEKVVAEIITDTSDHFKIFLDLFLIDDPVERVSFAEEGDNKIEFIIEEDSEYLLRLQSELLKGGNFNLSIKRTPSLAFPVIDKDSRAVKSFWSDPRDGGTREHKGVDIFAPKLTPVTAVAKGIITRTGTNNLGGKVIWLFAEGKSFYYAHLDSQLVSLGTFVSIGDTLGLVGNTGNAKYTPPHLHFGIYIPGKGAVNPLPFIRDIYPDTETITGSKDLISKLGRTKSKLSYMLKGKENKNYLVKRNTPVKIYGAKGKQFRIELPDGRKGFIPANNVEASEPLELKNVTSEMNFYSAPSYANEIELYFNEEKSLPVLGFYNDFLLLRYNNNLIWAKN